MSFYRKRIPVKFDYMIDGIVVNRVTSYRDLGVLFDQKMLFSGHIDYIVFKAYSKKCLMYMFQKFDWYHYVKLSPYYLKIKLFGLELLDDRRTNSCHYFMSKLLMLPIYWN